jgi:MSHA biogenesis protein MshJ
MHPQRLFQLFNARAMRERVLIAAAVLALLLAVWDSLLMQPLRNAKRNLDAELSSYGTAPTADDSNDPHQQALKQAAELQQQSRNLDAQVEKSARGFVPAQRMIAVLHDVLKRQGGLTLVSIRNLPVQSLIPPAQKEAPAAAPYVHSIELVIDGRYADIQAYVRELEALPWKFRWSLLELSTRSYPLNRVRLSLSTLSMDATWLGV